MEQNVWLDVRSIPQWQRHARVFALFDALLSGQALIVTSDHEPRPLRAQFEERYGKRFAWDQRLIGDGRWQVTIAKRETTADDVSPVAILRRNSIFSKASDAGIATLAQRSRHAMIKRHHSAVEQGVNWPYVGIVQHGIVQALLVTPTGREHAVYDVLADELFGETALLDAGLMPIRHVALTPNTAVLLVPADAVRELAQHEPAVLGALAALSAQRFRTVLERFSSHMSSPATARVAQVLLPFAPPGSGLRDALHPLPNMTQVEIATSAGTVKEVVSRALAELESSGALQRKGGHVVRLDRTKLTEIAAAVPLA